jgi:hypothetical protein
VPLKTGGLLHEEEEWAGGAKRDACRCGEAGTPISGLGNALCYNKGTCQSAESACAAQLSAGAFDIDSASLAVPGADNRDLPPTTSKTAEVDLQRLSWKPCRGCF